MLLVAYNQFIGKGIQCIEFIEFYPYLWQKSLIRLGKQHIYKAWDSLVKRTALNSLLLTQKWIYWWEARYMSILLPDRISWLIWHMRNHTLMLSSCTATFESDSKTTTLLSWKLLVQFEFNKRARDQQGNI